MIQDRWFLSTWFLPWFLHGFYHGYHGFCLMFLPCLPPWCPSVPGVGAAEHPKHLAAGAVKPPGRHRGLPAVDRPPPAAGGEGKGDEMVNIYVMKRC